MFSQVSRRFERRVLSFNSSVALSASFQKSSLEMKCSSSRRRFCFSGRSKILLEFFGFGSDGLNDLF
jgi:hypothetical protein